MADPTVEKIINARRIYIKEKHEPPTVLMVAPELELYILAHPDLYRMYLSMPFYPMKYYTLFGMAIIPKENLVAMKLPYFYEGSESDPQYNFAVGGPELLDL